MPTLFAALLAAFFLLVTPARAQTSGAPVVASLSNSQTVTEGYNLTLSVSANGTSPFTYQWQKAGAAIAGATASTLAFTPIRAADAGTYAVVVTNSVGSVTSGPVVLAVNPAVAPTFYYQPSNASFVSGNTISLSASVSGTEPLTFVWKRGSTTLATTTNSPYYSKANADATDAGTYTVTVSNVAGSITSSAFTVSVTSPTAPSFSYGPSDTTVETGGSFWFYPSVSSSTAVTYQWKKDGVAIAGATSLYFSKNNVQASDAGSYTVTATNSVGSTTSSAARVTVQPPVAPKISSVSGAVSVAAGDSFNLSVYASGTYPLSYQWRKDGVALTGATNSYYTKSSVQASDAGAYTVVVSNAQGSVTSSSVAVTVTNARPPVITYHPASFAVRLGTYLYSISVGASGSGTLTYQWSKDGTPISGATGYSLYLNRAATAADAGTYTVVVTSAQGSATSEPCVVTILPALPPSIYAQPASRTIRQGETLALEASVTGSSPLTIQWRKDGTNIAGATNTSYYKNNAASSDAAAYSFVATNSAGSVTSDDATITIAPVAAPKILTHPSSASLLPGNSFYGMFVSYSASTNTTVQWYRDGVLVAGATSAQYYIYDAQPSIAGTYTAVVTNSAGSVTSREAVITVDANTTRPVITYVPGSRAVGGGDYVSLNIATSSSGETVQWFKDGAAIPNATSKDYTFSNFALSSVGTYTAQVTNTSGTFTSRSIVLELLDSGVAPLITTQPVSVRYTGSYGTGFSVTAEGERPLTYQWRKDGVTIPGATASSYYLWSPVSANAGSYSVVVTNRNGSATSSAAVLTMATTPTAAPVITQHPGSQTATSNSGSVSLSVSVLDSTGVSYQWRKDGVPLTGSTSSYLYTTSAGRYSVVATNSVGSATSYDAVVAFTSSVTGPVFTVQPQSVESYYGANVTFTSSATSASAITYQWRKNGTAITGATNASLTLANVQSADAATYTVVATDANGSTPSAAVTLTLSGGTAPFIITAPANVTAHAGTAAAFTASVGGTPAPAVQWQRNGVDVAGATTLALNLTSVQASDAGNYTLVARNAVGTTTSAAAVLTVVYPPPTITTQPQSASVQAGGAATFAVTVSSVPEVTYQWRRDGVNIAGATSSSLSFSNVQSAQAGRYSVTVTSSFGSVTSVDALLTVGNPVTASVPRTVTATVGTAASLVASVQSVDPLLFQWAKNGIPIPGATSSTLSFTAVKLADAGTYSLGINRVDGTVIYPLTGSSALAVLLTVVDLKLPPVIAQQPVGGTLPLGGSLTLSVQAFDNGPLTYQWRKDGIALANQVSATLRLTNVQPADAGNYQVLVTGANGSTVSNPVVVVVTGSAFAGTYFGVFPNGDGWALQVNADGGAVFMALLSGLNQIVVARDFAVTTAGTFSFGRTAPVAASGGSTLSARYFDGMVSGSVSGTTVNGTIPGAGLLLTGQRSNAGAPTVPARSFQAVPLASEPAELNAIVAPDGTLFLVAADVATVRGARGTMEASGAFSVTQPQFSYRGTAALESGLLNAVFAPASGPSITFATPALAGGVERLVNVATRGLAGSGARTLTAGFVISGTAAKEVLIRAVGPGLAGFGVSGVLANPRLRIFKDATPVIENDDWALGGFAPQIADAANRVGAFSLVPNSADAAVLARLEPGAYTAQISTATETSGVALVEVYDTATPAAGAPKLVNLSTRGEVGRDGDILIVGVVVTGTAPKRLLIRGIGPALADFGVTGALADPKLQLYQGSVLVRENDNWSDASDATATSTVAGAVGAFALPPGSKDAALLLYLAPGSYTAQVSGVNGTTGVALVEAYEVP